MLPCQAADHQPHGTRSFFSLSVGTSDGWLFVVDSLSEMIMLDPTTGAELSVEERTPSLVEDHLLDQAEESRGNSDHLSLIWVQDRSPTRPA
ncbi:hypothetical protein QJS10_CPA06g02094 [Acorus calamus]|uniref:Uncharacterized protein n=1 Tax=Acorus calamus TaxID=4465 RepID=A0AAV9EJE8_ACOCL|nr:hypothetical protein QJS10_CPA06g02094 [Acorus calamus]